MIEKKKNSKGFQEPSPKASCSASRSSLQEEVILLPGLLLVVTFLIPGKVVDHAGVLYFSTPYDGSSITCLLSSLALMVFWFCFFGFYYLGSLSFAVVALCYARIESVDLQKR